jgi:fructosamine-3-kinase
LERLLGRPPVKLKGLSGGCVGQVYLVELPGDERLVVKQDESGEGRLDLEAYMLRYLAEHSALPVPAVEHAESDLMIMQWLPGRTGCGPAAEAHAGELVAGLHGIHADRFGLESDTLIGGLRQPNQASESWIEFFAEQRLLFMAAEAHRHGRLPAAVLAMVEKLAGQLKDWLQEPTKPCLLHGDLWAGNILSEGDRVTGFIDPAIYYGHPEVELAFMTLFGSFGEGFFAVYREIHGIEAGFEETRQQLYNIYPLLVHARLFGGSYIEDVERSLRRFV